MSSNADTHMTRFLFAILKQKSLKDIDWNEVARDPILSQPITNGHAARMRYSRFRSTMLGLEPQKRQPKSGVSKSRPTKQKKETKAIKQDIIKGEPSSGNTVLQNARDASLPKIKQEANQQNFNSPFTPTSAESPVTESSSGFQSRLLTPCSEDMFIGSPGLVVRPTGNILQPTSTFTISPSPRCNHDPVHSHSHEHPAGTHDHSHDNSAWARSPIYSPFDAAYELDGYGIAMCEHQHSHSHSLPTDVPLPTPLVSTHDQETQFSTAGDCLAEQSSSHVSIKHEPWDSQY